MLHLLTFQSINNALYFLWERFIEIFMYTPYTKKDLLWRGGIKNDVTEMLHLLTFQSIMNI